MTKSDWNYNSIDEKLMIICFAMWTDQMDYIDDLAQTSLSVHEPFFDELNFLLSEQSGKER